jgi:hypothetical protein
MSIAKINIKLNCKGQLQKNKLAPSGSGEKIKILPLSKKGCNKTN